MSAREVSPYGIRGAEISGMPPDRYGGPAVLPPGDGGNSDDVSPLCGHRRRTAGTAANRSTETMPIVCRAPRGAYRRKDVEPPERH